MGGPVVAVCCAGVSNLSTSAKINIGTLLGVAVGAKSGKSKVYLGVLELCSQCFMHDCLPVELCAAQGSPGSICITRSVFCGAGK